MGSPRPKEPMQLEADKLPLFTSFTAICCAPALTNRQPFPTFSNAQAEDLEICEGSIVVWLEKVPNRRQ